MWMRCLPCAKHLGKCPLFKAIPESERTSRQPKRTQNSWDKRPVGVGIQWWSARGSLVSSPCWRNLFPQKFLDMFMKLECFPYFKGISTAKPWHIEAANLLLQSAENGDLRKVRRAPFLSGWPSMFLGIYCLHIIFIIYKTYINNMYIYIYICSSMASDVPSTPSTLCVGASLASIISCQVTPPRRVRAFGFKKCGHFFTLSLLIRGPLHI